MRVTITIDDDLYAQALEVAEPAMGRDELFREAIELFVRLRAAERLSALGGAAPQMLDVPRRRST